MKHYTLVISVLVLGACSSGEPPADAEVPVAQTQTTAQVHAGDEPVATPITEVPPRSPVSERELVYGTVAQQSLNGFFAAPADFTEPPPGIIMIHEWWGLNDNIRAMARRLAGEGYAVLAVDLYGGRTADTPDDAQRLMGELGNRREQAIENLRQAYDYLDQYALAPRVGLLGWCLGGGWSLEGGLALAGSIDAVVMYYGQVIVDQRLAELDAPLLGIFAELDASIPVASVQRFRRRLDALDKDGRVLIYSDVDHAFANPSGNAYDHEAAATAWDETLGFLAARLEPPPIADAAQP